MQPLTGLPDWSFRPLARPAHCFRCAKCGRVTRRRPDARAL